MLMKGGTAPGQRGRRRQIDEARTRRVENQAQRVGTGVDGAQQILAASQPANLEARNPGHGRHATHDPGPTGSSQLSSATGKPNCEG
jgi:hypothetical protein